jgi:arylsulfatase A-like enzyme
MEGRSLRPLVEGRVVPWRDELFLESLFTLRDNPFQEGIRTNRWKYIRMYDGVMSFKEADVDFKKRAPEFEMLFDLEADPGEHRNLASDPTHTAVLAGLREKTAEQSIAINQRRATYIKANIVQPRATAAP